MTNYNWIFYKDESSEWRWRKKSMDNGNIVGASSEGFKNKSDCKDNAKIMGWDEEADLTEWLNRN